MRAPKWLQPPEGKVWRWRWAGVGSWVGAVFLASLIPGVTSRPWAALLIGTVTVALAGWRLEDAPPA